MTCAWCHTQYAGPDTEFCTPEHREADRVEADQFDLMEEVR